MVFGPWISALAWCKTHMPKKGAKIKWWTPSLNFITLHYAYIIFQTLLGSVIMYGGSGMAYIDALFFASGAATQSGLNTIDVNKTPLHVQVWSTQGGCAS
jgi:hypothetical protein